jgi:hypothetical protein
MSTYDSMLDHDPLPVDDTNVVPFRPRGPRPEPIDADLGVIDMERYPVDIRGHVTFGRLVSGLSQVGLTVRIDPRTGRVVITDEMYEPA